MHNPSRRPVYLNLLQIKLPIGGWVSILHRISGVFLTLLLPFAIYLLGQSLAGMDGYTETVHFLSGAWGRLLALLTAAALIHHLLAGLRHLLLDLHIGMQKTQARQSALAVLVGLVLLSLVTGIWLW